VGTPVQEVVARLWKRQQTPTGWLYQVGLPAYRNRRLEKTPQSTAREFLGARRPSGWVLQKLTAAMPSSRWAAS
jgi:hypothetical protein